MEARLENLQLNDISSKNRAREQYGEIYELAKSIEFEGLIQPIAVVDCAKAKIECEKSFLLVAGGRRFYACRDILKWTSIPCRVFEHVLSMDEIKTLELVENVQRKNLEPFEELKLKNEIHELQVRMKGVKISTRPDAPGHSVTDTAKMLNQDKSTVAKDLKIAKAMKQFKDVDWSKFKSKSDIEKAIKKAASAVTNINAAKRVEDEILKCGNDSFCKRLVSAYMVNDFFVGVKSVEDRSLDFVEIDPPFGISLTSSKKGDTSGYNEVEANVYPQFVEGVLKEAYRTMKRDSWGVFWYAPEPWHETIRSLIIKTGFQTWGSPCVWFKAKDGDSQSVGQNHLPETRLASSLEYFFYFWKGEPKLNRPGMSNGFNYKPIPYKQKYHPTQKPLELYRDIYTTFCRPGSRVMVPFVGSGASLIAAALEKISAFGWDLTADFRNSYVLEVNKQFNGK